MKYRPKHVLEYVLLRMVEFVVKLLPLRMSLFTGWLLARISVAFARRRVRHAKARIRQVFGGQFGEKDVDRIAWLSFRNMAFNAMEMMRMPSFSSGYIDRYIDAPAMASFREKLSAGQGAILVVPHMGNWDMAGVAAFKLGLPVFALAARQRNPLTDAYLNRMRGATGMPTLLRGDPSLSRTILRNLKEGKILAIMNDIRSRTPGLTIRFLGGKANLAGGMALFARQADVPIYPVVVLREGWTRHRWIVYDPIYPQSETDKQQDAVRMTQQVMDIFDAAIRKWPEQYFWYNKRWVLDPL